MITPQTLTRISVANAKWKIRLARFGGEEAGGPIGAGDELGVACGEGHGGGGGECGEQRGQHPFEGSSDH